MQFRALLALLVAVAALKAAAAATKCKGPTVKVAQGSLCGKKNSKGQSEFLGIPYAEPPVGNLRWKDPVRKGAWNGVRSATKECHECLQAVLSTPLTTGHEDCLCLNVYVPKATGSPLPVMVWIHGGAFVAGSGNAFMYNPSDLVEKNVIVVTINYRLGVLGFFNIGNKEAPGNQGLKDQVVALRWVQENIKSFGGDPNLVTIFGESAGSVSVHMHTMSAMSKGLFVRAIAQSGSALNTWGYNKTTECANRKLFQATKCPPPKGGDVSATLECLRRIDAKTFQAPTSKFTCGEEAEDSSGGLIAFPPTLDGTFLPEDPVKLGTKCNSISMLVGYNSCEGMISLPSLRRINGYAGWTKKISQGEGMKQNGINCTPSSAKLADWGKASHQHFLNGQTLSEANAMGFVNYATFCSFVWGINLALDWRVGCSTSQPQYLYLFDADTILNHAKQVFGGITMKGAAHADELSYIFRFKVDDAIPILPNNIKKTRQSLISMWTNFAKCGNPTPETDTGLPVAFKQYKKDEKNYMYINNQGMEMRKNPFEKDMTFYSSLVRNC